MQEWPRDACSPATDLPTTSPRPKPAVVSVPGPAPLAHPRPRVAVLSLARRGGMGEAKRVASWVSIFEAAGAEVTTIPLLRDHRARYLSGGAAVLKGTAVPETLAWSQRSVARELARLEADVVVCVTARAFHPSWADGRRTVVVDFVDRLSVSYRDRAGITGPWSRRLLFHGLAVTSRRFEGRSLGDGVRTVAAGWDDARHLGAEWVPIVVEPPGPAAGCGAPDCDVLFFGNLAYPPNVAAVERLARLWPAVLARRPGTTARIAGANVTPAVRALAAGHGWDLVSDFPSVSDLCAGARLAVAPLTHTAGIQIKVLEAAALGLAQVVTPAVVRGMQPGFPVTVAATDDELATAIVELLDDPGRRDREGAAARRHMARHYTAEAWSTWPATLSAAVFQSGR
ncbi:MAG: polysaccharide biosynthesis protein PslH [Actinomycetota bacterium]|nr:polysaccharide biosynthesis protein PslH [Actinomycetota bacterium]